tara:strand:- start:426 stop:1445 length:1020 start_codon:yes stop_codon:yes gene_type:complete
MSAYRMRASAVCACLFALVCLGIADGIPTLYSYNIDPDRTTVSGVSSGGYMAVQMHVAYSSLIQGAGVFAGGPYHCAQDSLSVALTLCGNTKVGPTVSTLETTTEKRSGVSIDDVKNLTDDKAYLFTGSKDTVVTSVVVEALQDYYKYFGVDVNLEKYTGAEHCHPTDDKVNKNACSYLGSPYISDCSYDGAGKALQFIYNNELNDRNNGDLDGVLTVFNQSDFGDKSVGLNEYGYVYIPQTCANLEKCGVHVAFHGCEMNYDYIGSSYAEDSGYNKWADTNNLIVLYPQTVSTKGLSMYNPDACWDWWGYTTKEYDERTGPQMVAIYNMIQRLMGNYP